MNDETDDPLVEAALTATDGGTVDWDRLSREAPGERGTIEELAALTEVVAAFRADADDVSSPSDTVAFRWGPLEVRHRIGSGSFGEVFVARDPRLDREVALKLRRPGASERSKRWLDEARRLARIRHPNVVTVYGADEHDGRAGLWMDLVHGRTLEERLRHEGPLGAREAAIVGAELCAALAAVHGQGLVHGDVKTHNVMREGVPGVARDAGRVVLMDFGSAHESSARPGPGTPLFTAPEVLAGARPTPASDVWSLGVVLYRLVTGRWPVEATTVEELRTKLASSGPTPLRSLRPELPSGFVALVERALERDPARRWSDAAALERELLAGIGADRGFKADGPQPHAQRRARFAAGAAALALVAVGVWFAVTRGERAWMAWHTRELPLLGQLLAERAGPSANAFMGSWVQNVGDLNGDGHDDVVAAAYGANETGEVYLMTPSVSGLEPIMTFRGEKSADAFGAVAAPGDINGDGHPDLAIAAINSDHGGRDSGRLYIYFGGPGMDSIPDVVMDGRSPAQYFGYGIGGGDVNGDGWNDLLVGAPYDRQAGAPTGRAWVYFGGPKFDTIPDLEVADGTEGSVFGETISFIGDFNNDGFGDFAVSARGASGANDHGATFIYYGGPRLDARPDLVLHGTIPHEGFGAVRLPTGDLNGDGYVDLAIASEGGNGLEPRAGSVSIFFGGPDADGRPDLVLKGEQRGNGFGTWVDGSHDLDGDGLADLFVSAPWYDVPNGPNSGRAYVYLGGRHMDAVPDFEVTGAPHSTMGTGGCLFRNPDGGLGAMLVGSKNANGAYTQSGAIALYDIERWVIRPPQPGDGWAPGRQATLHWSGVTPADVALSIDGGRTWRVVARHAGGARQNQIAVPVPAEAHDGIRVRLVGDARARDAVVRAMPLSR